MTRSLLSRAEVAERLSISPDAFRRRYVDLRADGFPAAVFGEATAGARWDPAAIDRWLDLKLPAAPIAVSPAVVVDLSNELAARARRLAEQGVRR